MKNTLTLLSALCLISFGVQAQFKTHEYPMMKGIGKTFKNGWNVDPLVTVGETNNDGDDVNLKQLNYRVPGIMDGIGAYKKGPKTVQALVNHEIPEEQGYPYYLSNGTALTGARISYFDIDPSKRNVKSAGLAYDKVFDRAGKVVTSANQINEGLAPGTINGFTRFCSSYLVEAGYNGFVNRIYFTGEETSSEGQLCALDVNAKDIHVVPMAGRAAWENVTSIENYSTNKVALVIGDDRGGAPLLLYIGEKGTTALGYNPMQPFLMNNGLANGHLYVWVSDAPGETSPVTFNGTGAVRTGKFVKIDHYKPELAGTARYDAMGFATQATQDTMYYAAGHFQFSRPEDVATNPHDYTQVVLASTGITSLFGGVESWGTTYKIDFDDSDLKSQLNKSLHKINNIMATITILYDGNDSGGGMFPHPDYGIRNPDNVDWSHNDYIYINEDPSLTEFGLTSGIESSVWQLNHTNSNVERILEMDRNAVPFMQQDDLPSDTGNWESSGVLDVTHLFATKPGETLLIMDVQAHTITTGLINGSMDLVQGGQLFFASKMFSGSSERFSGSNLETSEISKLELSVKPVPAEDIVYLNKSSNIQVYNSQGQQVFSGLEINQLDVTSFPAGIYVLRTDKNESIKIVVQ
ncbi:MAG: T9SS type A sorting domain-containing protein [Chitinophagales bacterium]|nr:T9SS type A sorting domain-containing protein [Chitinophagales bacterium]